MKKYSIKLYEIWRYVLWYIIMQAFTSYFLIYGGIIKLENKESIFGYIIFNDVIITFSCFMIGTIISVYFGAFLSSNFSHKQLLTKDIFKFKYAFTKRLVDILLKFLLTVCVLSMRLKDIKQLTSNEKIQYIGLAFFVILVLITLIKYVLKSIGIELISMLELIGSILLIPFSFYKNMKLEVDNSLMPDKIKKLFRGLVMAICIVTFIVMIFALISVFYTVFNNFK